MIEAKVVFKGNDVIVGNWLIFVKNSLVVATENGKDVDYFKNLEQAIAWCLEN